MELSSNFESTRNDIKDQISEILTTVQAATKNLSSSNMESCSSIESVQYGTYNCSRDFIINDDKLDMVSYLSDNVYNSVSHLSTSNEQVSINFDNSIEVRGFMLKIINTLENIQGKLQDEFEKNIILNDKYNKLNADYKRIKNYNRELAEDINKINDDIYSIDTRLIRSEQYTRRESLIISGIPDNIKQSDLEQTALSIIRKIGIIDVTSYQVVACHRLIKKGNKTKYPANTIIRFTNRRIVETCLQNKGRLLDIKPFGFNLRFFESLCSSNEEILSECYDLQKYGFISDFYIRNGFIKIICKDNSRPFKVQHPYLLYDRFKDYFEHNDLW